MHREPKASIAMAAQDYSRERSHKRERSRSRDRNSKRSRRSPVPENVKEPSRSHRSRSRDRQRTKRDPSPDRSRPLDFAARQAARGDPEDRATGKPDRDAQRSSKHSRSDSRDVRVSRHSRERDREDGDRHRRDHDRSHGNGRASSKDRQNDSRKADPAQPASLPGPPPAQEDTPAVPVRKAEPLSLEELLRKKQEEQAALAKVCLVRMRSSAHRPICKSVQFCKSRLLLQPKFLSKKEREELALKRRQEEVELQKQK